MRQMISFKIGNLPDKQRKVVDDWANEQANIQQSLANLIMHVVGFIGNADVMDFDVQRKLHSIFTNEQLNISKPEQNHVEPVKYVEQIPPVREEKPSEQDIYTKASKLFED